MQKEKYSEHEGNYHATNNNYINHIVRHKSNQSSQTHGKADTSFWDSADTDRSATLLLTYRMRGCPWETVLMKATGACRPETEPCTRGRGGPPQCTLMHSEAECWGAFALSLSAAVSNKSPPFSLCYALWLAGESQNCIAGKNTAASSFLLQNAVRFAVTPSHLLSLSLSL